MDHHQIAINGDDCEVDHGSVRSPPDKVFTEYRYAQPITEHSFEVDITKLQHDEQNQKEATEKIKSILTDNQHVLFVLFRDHQGVEDESISPRVR